MKLYHVKYETDARAGLAHQQTRIQVAEAGGTSHFAQSFGHGPAFVVATLPDSVDPTTIFGDQELADVTPVEEVDAEPTQETGVESGDAGSAEGDAAGSESEEAAPVGSPAGDAE